MKTTKLLASLAALILILSTGANAQDGKAGLPEDKAVISGIYGPYHSIDPSVTAPPKGYKPFYISHYGRHGSRYHTSFSSHVGRGISGLEKADSAGILTEKGKALYADIRILGQAHVGMDGQLSPRGGREHQGIADRMYHNYKRVFKNKHRSKIVSISSLSQRCIMSMAYFTNRLKADNPDLDIELLTGDKYYRLVVKSYMDTESRKALNHVEDSLRDIYCHYDEFYSYIFTDPKVAEELIPDPQQFMKSVFRAGGICNCLDFLNLEIFDYMPENTLREQYELEEIREYGNVGGALEWRRNMTSAARALLQDFITKADEAIADDSNVAANLRFGHDTGIMPLILLMNLDVVNEARTVGEAASVWNTYDTIPMGTNLQLIFFKNRKGDVIVKILHNETETGIKAIPPVSGPFYRWSDLKEYFLSRIEANGGMVEMPTGEEGHSRAV